MKEKRMKNVKKKCLIDWLQVARHRLIIRIRARSLIETEVGIARIGTEVGSGIRVIAGTCEQILGTVVTRISRTLVGVIGARRKMVVTHETLADVIRLTSATDQSPVTIAGRSSRETTAGRITETREAEAEDGTRETDVTEEARLTGQYPFLETRRSRSNFSEPEILVSTLANTRIFPSRPAVNVSPNTSNLYDTF